MDNIMIASTRDASWYNCPDTRSPKKWHIVDGEYAQCSKNILLVLENAVKAQEVHEALRCKRCRGWPPS